MADDDLILMASAAFIVLKSEEREEIRNKNVEQKTTTKRRLWMNSLFLNRDQNKRRKREDLMRISTSYAEDDEEHHNVQDFCKMHTKDFEFILKRIEPKIARQNTCFREAIPASDRLLLTLRYLTTGDSYTRLMYAFKVSKQLISKIIPEVCEAIIETLKDYIKMPSTSEDWQRIAQNFESKCNFPHCIGVLDGRHCLLKAQVFNSSKILSVVLVGVVDADYCYTFGDVYCEEEDVLKKMKLKNLPTEEALPKRQKSIPYVFVGDEAFALQGNVITAYPEQNQAKEEIFNKRLNKAHRISENTFGVMSGIFKVLQKPMMVAPEKAIKVALACMYLHNFLRKSKYSRNLYTPPGIFDAEKDGKVILGDWRERYQNKYNFSFLPLKKGQKKDEKKCKEIREEFAEYFASQVAKRSLYK